MWWFWWWLVFVLILLVLPLGHGWGYRRWGPPYPSWSPAAHARRAQEIATWGLLADLVWLVLIVALVWLFAAALI